MSGSKAEFRSGFVAIVGPANAGKSTLLNALLGRKVSIVSPKAHTTRDRILGIHTTADAQLIYVDTPGFVRRLRRNELSRAMHSVTVDGASEADVVLLVLDAARLVRAQDSIQSVIVELRERGIRSPDILALNKVDLVAKEALLPLIAACSEELKQYGGNIPDIVPISARVNDGLKEFEAVVAAKLPIGPMLFPEEVGTDKPEHFIAAEIVREKLFYLLRDELPYSVATVVESWEENETIARIHVTILVERTSQRAIVLGSGGEMLKRIGTSARQELERIFGIRIFLGLFVRVEPDWTRTHGGLNRAGYAIDALSK